MFQLWPDPAVLPASPAPLSDDELARAYAYPAAHSSTSSTGSEAPYVRVNFVSSADGAVSADGRSAGLSSAPDRRVFHLLRRLADVILVGAGTARAERYRGARQPSEVTGLPPRIAVVTRGAELDPTGPLFTDTAVAPLVLTTRAASEGNRRRLAEAGAEVVELDSHRSSTAGLLAALASRGLRRVLCEGGPHLFGSLIEADAVDELCLTVAPLLAGAGAGRIAAGPRHVPCGLRLAGVLTAEDVLLLRYRRGG